MSDQELSTVERSNTLSPSNGPGNHIAPFGQRSLGAGANVGAVAIEQERAIAEVQGQLILAKRFPRDLNAAHAELMLSCSLMSMASQAFYSVPNRGTGPSIRLAEEIARVFQNFEFGHRELSRGDGKSEIEVYAWDKQTNNRSTRQITVMHVVDTKQGPKKLTDQSDIDNKIANVASKQVRGRILQMMPKWLVQDAVDRCKQTLAGNSDEPMAVRVRKMTQAFSKYGVTDKHLVEYLGHSLDDVVLDELVDLTGVFNSIKEGAKPSEFFGNKEAEAEANAEKASSLKASAAAGAAAPAKGPRATQKVVQATLADVVLPQSAQPQQTAAPKDSKQAENQSKATEEKTEPVTETTSQQAEPPPDDSGEEELF